MSDMHELSELIRQYDFINEERWGDDEKEPPTWEEVRDKHLFHWRNKNMTFEFWSEYMRSLIIETARVVCRKHVPVESIARAVEAGPIGNRTTSHLNLTTPLQPIQKPSIAITRGKKK